MTQKAPVPLSARIRKQTAIFSRWAHTYLSMVAFAIVMFFAVTGLTLNHADWFASQLKTTERSGALPVDWLKDERHKLEVVEKLRAEGVHGAVSDYRVDDAQVAVSFKAPGYAADTFVDRATGKYQLTITNNGIVAVLNDLHKGRDSGKAWGWVIDVSAVLLTLVSLSGLLLLFFVYKRRLSGLVMGALGGLVCWLVWMHYVP